MKSRLPSCCRLVSFASLRATRSCHAFVTSSQRTRSTLQAMADAIAGAALVLAVLGVLLLFALARPSRCPSCGVRAVAAEEYELSSTPRVVAITDRCPRCGGVVARRTVGAYGD